ncbi:D-alanyl-D-alanine carboxypeptidase family protein [Candidatus Woesearchaeota archaeon]|nr:D-alanyl-D-alanine carboxypeptidase family protein [Candidatus Woesearchaeota archaeon]
MKNKKASFFFLPLLVILSSLILIYLFIVLLSKTGTFSSSPIGDRQFTLLKVYMKAEGALFYIDQSAKYSLQQAVYDLARDGGLSEVYASEILTPREHPTLHSPIKECGKYYGYFLWNDKGVDCFSENKIKLNLELQFNEKFSGYIANYPSEIQLNNYIYDIRGSTEIIGISKDPLKFEILKDESIKKKEETLKRIPKEEKRIIGPEQMPTLQEISGFKDFSDENLCAKGIKCRLTLEAYQKAADAQRIAKEKGKELEVYSAFRSEQEQRDLWEGRTPEKYAQRFPTDAERAKYVCNPNKGLASCPHMSGKAVDVRFKKTMTVADWKELEGVMYKAGFRRYSAELWHYECCGTDRYNRAVALEQKTGQEVRAIS